MVDNTTFAKDCITKEGYLMRTLRDVGSEAKEQANGRRSAPSCRGSLVESSGSFIEGKVGQPNTAQAISSPRNELLLDARWKPTRRRYILKLGQSTG